MSIQGIRPKSSSDLTQSERISTPSLGRAKPVASQLTECRHYFFLPWLLRMTHELTQTGDLAAVARIMLELMQQQLRVERASISCYDERTGQMLVHEHCGLSAEQLLFGLWNPGEHLTRQTLAQGQAVIIPDVRQEPELLAFYQRTQPLADTEVLSFICIPLTRQDRVLGSINLERPYDSLKQLRWDAEMLSALAAPLAQAAELQLMQTTWHTALKKENRQLHSALRGRFNPNNIIGHSKPMRAVYRMLEKVTRAKTTVLILGEKGVGKALVAHAIHYNGPWADKPFVSFSCANRSEELIERELFGYEQGAFPGATTQRRGRFEQANGGTLFLDEIAELPLSMQAKLLRVLQEKSFERLGSSVTIQVDLRLLAATSRPLKHCVAEGTFREELYYRLNVFPINVPPLRERLLDILALAEHFVGRYALTLGIEAPKISSAALSMLTHYHWPGNVQELEHVIEQALLCSEGQLIEPKHLPCSLHPPSLPEPPVQDLLDTRLGIAERKIIIEALTQTRGNTTEAAAQLGLTRRMLGLRMQKYDLHYKDYRV
ncbi:Nif-specific regulatory protein [Azomonas agilis]|uniref:Nif-specific regulatory protein n=1 Tax=Azomonas agilis TaxID=116849 RepID=A0A562J0B8_9GAMM|nr:sigma-54-dependent Fis family transcriptional regulator [Azomonas agilis]TWH76235.1 Nif-specific regulatory protein [Azomonas agilis]